MQVDASLFNCWRCDGTTIMRAWVASESIQVCPGADGMKMLVVERADGSCDRFHLSPEAAQHLAALLVAG